MDEKYKRIFYSCLEKFKDQIKDVEITSFYEFDEFYAITIIYRPEAYGVRLFDKHSLELIYLPSVEFFLHDIEYEIKINKHISELEQED